MYLTNDYNLRFFFLLASGPNHKELAGTTKIIDKASYYLSGNVDSSSVEEVNKTKIDFIRHHDERSSIKVFFD